MISYEEALGIIRQKAVPLETERVFMLDSLNRVMAEDVLSDTNIPPFNKSAMDGYACRRADLENELKVIGVIPAGSPPGRKVGPGECAKIMTGSAVPEGADTVVMVEFTEPGSPGHIRFTGTRTAANICIMGEDVKAGELVLERGVLVRPRQIPILATAGAVTPLVYKLPRVGIIATGDEIVEPDQKPSAFHIRNSNAYSLSGQLTAMGIVADYYGIAGDTREKLDLKIKKAKTENSVILLSGGVSMGDFDLVPRVLKDNGFTLLFEKIKVKPGKPTVFGVSDRCCCFGLPGNPVSTFIIFELFVKHCLYLMMGHEYKPLSIKAPLEEDIVRKKTARRSFLPVAFTSRGHVAKVDYHGSGHLHSLYNADGLISIPTGTGLIKAGTGVNVRLLC